MFFVMFSFDVFFSFCLFLSPSLLCVGGLYWIWSQDGAALIPLWCCQVLVEVVLFCFLLVFCYFLLTSRFYYVLFLWGEWLCFELSGLRFQLGRRILCRVGGLA
jgi:hypothetical protein